MKQVTKDEFTTLYNEMTTRELARLLDVDRTTIWKHAKKIGLSKANRGLIKCD